MTEDRRVPEPAEGAAFRASLRKRVESEGFTVRITWDGEMFFYGLWLERAEFRLGYMVSGYEVQQARSLAVIENAIVNALLDRFRRFESGQDYPAVPECPSLV